MTTKDNKLGVIGISFVAVIIYLSASVINKFDYLDLAYLLFIIGCFIRFIYIKKFDKTN